MTTATTVRDSTGTVIGRVTRKSAKSFSASRIHGVAGVDIRMYSTFRNEAAALAFVNKIA